MCYRIACGGFPKCLALKGEEASRAMETVQAKAKQPEDTSLHTVMKPVLQRDVVKMVSAMSHADRSWYV